MSSTVRQKRYGYAIHTLTASGAVVAMFALQSIFDGNTRMALVWLVISQILDGLDGPVARRFDVTLHAPRIDGHILDLVVDFVTCVIVPIAFMAQAAMLPAQYESVLAGFMILFAALWFSRTDLETDDNWFNGFPAAWNLVIPTLYLANANTTVVAVVCGVLCISQLTNLQFPHIVRAGWMRQITLPFGALYLIDLSYVSYQYNDVTGINLNVVTGGLLFGFPIYATVIGLIKTVRDRRLRLASA